MSESGLARIPSLAPPGDGDLLLRSHRAGRIASFEISFHEEASVQLGPDWHHLFGVPQATFDGSYAGWLALIHEDDRSRVKQEVQDCLTRRSNPFETTCRVVRPDGRPARVELRGVLDDDPGGVRLTGVALDLTGHDVTTAALAARNLRHEILADAAARLISGDDPDSTVAGFFKIVAERLGLDVCFNYLTGEREGVLSLGSQVGLSPEEARQLARLPIGAAVCGMVAQTGQWWYVPEVQVSDDPAAALIRSMGIRAYASYPLQASGQLLGTLSFGSRQRARFEEEELTFFRTISHHVAAMKQRQLADRERQLLSAELSHRVRNVFAVVQALATQTDGDATSAEQYRQVLLGRLRAQTRAHGLLLDAHRQRADLRRLVEEILQAYRFERPDVIVCEGPDLQVDARQTVSLSLILHELGTNAAKHGALAAPTGRVRVAWREQQNDGQRQVRLDWTEEGGPPVTPPSHKGFGTRLIEHAAHHDLNGRAELVHPSEGLRCVIEFPLE